MSSDGLSAAYLDENVENLKEAISDGANVNDKVNGETPLFVAANYNSLSCAEVLLENGASVNEPSGDLDSPPLHAAVYHGLVEMAKLLMKHGADLNQRNRVGQTPMHIAAANPAKTDMEMLELLYDQGADMNLLDTTDGWTALHFAAANGNEQAVKFLVAAQDVNARTRSGCNALHVAAFSNQPHVIGDLVDAGTYLGMAERQFGFTPLHFAIYCEFEECERELMDRGADATRKDAKGRDCEQIRQLGIQERPGLQAALIEQNRE